MDCNPLFSIILPTRNRSMIVEEAIKSVIQQTSQDWELIIVDNDLSNDTYLVVSQYISDKIKYIRTGELAMHDNWQRGIESIRGTYVTILEDKATYSPDALEQVVGLIETVPNLQMIVMGFSVNDACFPYPSIENPPIYSFSSTEVLQLLLYEVHNQISPILPKMIFSFCHRSVIDWCNEQSESFFQPYSPDYSSMYIQLAYFDILHFIEAPLVHFNNEYSNGQKFLHKKYDDDMAQDFLRLSTGGSLEPLYKYSKIRFSTIYNIIMNDYEHIRDKFSKKLLHHPMSVLHNYKEVINQIHECENIGIDMNNEREILNAELQKSPKFIKNIIGNYENMIKAPYFKGPSDYATSFMVEIIRTFLNGGNKIAVWGAGDITKYILLQLGNDAKLIDCVVDSSEKKQGQMIQSCQLEIYPPNELFKRTIDIVLVSTLEWQSEVEAQIRSMHLKCKVLSPLTIKNFLNI